MARLVGSLVENPKSAIASDSLHLPKIYPEAVPVFDSVDSVGNYQIFNKALTRVAPVSILIFSPEPALTLAFYLLGGFIYNVLFFISRLLPGNGQDIWF